MHTTNSPTEASAPRLSIVEAARYAGIAARTLRNRIERGHGPQVERIGRRIVISPISLERWISSEPAPMTRELRAARSHAGCPKAA